MIVNRDRDVTILVPMSFPSPALQALLPCDGMRALQHSRWRVVRATGLPRDTTAIVYAVAVAMHVRVCAMCTIVRARAPHAACQRLGPSSQHNHFGTRLASSRLDAQCERIPAVHLTCAAPAQLPGVL